PPGRDPVGESAETGARGSWPRALTPGPPWAGNENVFAALVLARRRPDYLVRSALAMAAAAARPATVPPPEATRCPEPTAWGNPWAPRLSRGLPRISVERLPIALFARPRAR